MFLLLTNQLRHSAWSPGLKCGSMSSLRYPPQALSPSEFSLVSNSYFSDFSIAVTDLMSCFPTHPILDSTCTAGFRYSPTLGAFKSCCWQHWDWARIIMHEQPVVSQVQPGFLFNNLPCKYTGLLLTSANLVSNASAPCQHMHPDAKKLSVSSLVTSIHLSYQVQPLHIFLQ